MKRVNIIVWDNGGGLTRDKKLLADVLCSAGFEVMVNGQPASAHPSHARPPSHRRYFIGQHWQVARRAGRRVYDINLFVEEVVPASLRTAHVNCLIPNPEWVRPDFAHTLPALDWVLCKTHEGQRVFDALGSRTEYTSFTGVDVGEAAHKTERKFLHVAGRSAQKGTDAILKLWQRHPEWPALTLIQSPRTYDGVSVRRIDAPNIDHVIANLDEATLRRYQNAHGIHLCPSETEGFGHYIAEAMSCGAVVVTLDAPPMNELVTPDRGVLVRPGAQGRMGLSTTYFPDLADMERAIAGLIDADVAALQQLSAHARRWFEENDRYFRARLPQVLEQIG